MGKLQTIQLTIYKSSCTMFKDKRLSNKFGICHIVGNSVWQCTVKGHRLAKYYVTSSKNVSNGVFIIVKSSINNNTQKHCNVI